MMLRRTVLHGSFKALRPRGILLQADQLEEVYLGKEQVRQKTLQKVEKAEDGVALYTGSVTWVTWAIAIATLSRK